MRLPEIPGTKVIEIEKLGSALGHVMKSSSVRSQEGFERRMQRFLSDCQISLSQSELSMFQKGFWAAYSESLS